MINSDKIVIVGGGSAGWMTAATLIKYYPDRDITLIESDNIPKIGVGESTLAGLTAWLSALEIDHEDFMSYTDASYKLSIKFTDFYKKGDGGFQYPFGRPTLVACSLENGNDWHVLKAFDNTIKKQDYVNSFFPQSVLLETNKIFFPENDEMDTFSMRKDYALQFDAIKFAEWLKDRYAKPMGVKHIIADVLEVNTNEEGVSSLSLGDGSEFVADLYIDCTGFNSLLLGKALNTPFESLEDVLPVNKAWAVQIPYEDPENEIQNFTNCTGLGYGWVWNAPLYSRIGTGYVYSDRFTTSEEALEEFKEHLREVKGAHRITDDLKFREVSFTPGISSKPWNKNVVGIGLAGAFIEPLESNGLYFIHENASNLVKSISRGHVSKFDQETYNFTVRKHFNNFSSFIQLHYLLSSRSDTSFWRYMTSRDVVKGDITRETAHQWVQEMDGRLLSQSFDATSGAGFHCIAAGNEWSPVHPISINFWKYHYPETDFKLIVEAFKIKTDLLKLKWNAAIKDAPSHYRYLKEKFHKEEA